MRAAFHPLRTLRGWCAEIRDAQLDQLAEFERLDAAVQQHPVGQREGAQGVQPLGQRPYATVLAYQPAPRPRAASATSPQRRVGPSFWARREVQRVGAAAKPPPGGNAEAPE